MDVNTYIIQDSLSQEVLANHFRTLGFVESYLPQYVRIYNERYKRAVEKEVPNASDFALYCANNFMPWYDFYIKLGHSQLWADSAGKFAADTLQPVRVTYESDPEILIKTFTKCYRVAKDAAIPELRMHCTKIAQGWGKGVPYGKKYAEMIIAGADARTAAKESDRYTRFCKRARAAGMSESTMWYFANMASEPSCNPDHAWKLAQIREELLNQGYEGDDLDERMEGFRKEVTSKTGRRRKKNPRNQQSYSQDYPQNSYPEQYAEEPSSAEPEFKEENQHSEGEIW